MKCQKCGGQLEYGRCQGCGASPWACLGAQAGASVAGPLALVPA